MLVKNAMMAALFAVTTNAFVSTKNFWKDENGGTPMPGATQIFLNVPSLSTLLKDITTFVPYYTLVGKSFDVSLDKKIAGVEFTLQQVNITAFSIGDASMAFVGDTNTIRTTFINTDVTLNVAAQAKSGLPIVLDVTQIQLTNFTFQLDLATTSDDQVHWQLVENSLISLQDIEVTVKQKIWQKTIDALKPEMLKSINYALKVAQGVLLGATEAFNVVLAGQTENTFVFDVLGLPLNFTMTRYPEFNNA